MNEIKCIFCGKSCKLRDRQDEIGKYQIALCSECDGACIKNGDGEVFWYDAITISNAVRVYLREE